MREQKFFEKLWEVFSPLLFYELLVILYGELLELVTGGQPPGDGKAMWLLTLENLLMLPVFWILYNREKRKWKSGEKCVVPEKNMEGKCFREKCFGFSDALWLIAGAVCLSRGVNYVLSLTPLPYWFPGYETVSERIYECSLASQIMASVVSASLLEEVLMRGLFYGRLRRITGSFQMAALGSALAFALFHGNVVQGVYAFVMGLFLARIYETFQFLLPAVLAHMAANGASILAGRMFRPAKMEGLGLPFYYLTAALFLLAGLFCQKRLFQKHPD